MKTNKSKGIIPAVLLPLLLITVNAAAGTEQPAEFLGFTWEDFQNMIFIALGVGAIAFLAFFTSKSSKEEKKPGPQGPVVRKQHHHHHRVHKIRR